jgi:hypothetical protein
LKLLVPHNLKVGNNICCCLPFCFAIIRKIILNCCSKLNHTFCGNFSLGFSSATFHRFFLLLGLAYLVWSDFFRFGPEDSLNAAIRSGGKLSASSSWLDYTVDKAFIYEELLNPDVLNDNFNMDYIYKPANPLNQSSWCANQNSTGEWIQVSVPNTEYW